MLKAKINLLFTDLSWCFIGKTLGDRRTVNKPFKAQFLERSFILVELAPGYTLTSTGL
jgi:hypothetical protein